MESKNIFESHFGGLIAFFAVLVFFGAFYFKDLVVRNTIWTVFFFIYGGIFVWNWKRTEKIRYLVSAIAFFLAGLVGIVNTYFVSFVKWQVIWVATAVVVAISGPIASLFGNLSEKVDDKN